ncbi:hypothetical protein J8J14_16880 [Roseomonas sp. SSH11]|uniref:Uncharacterized protein n=1 Tax=Pararoseomonas baculiformis TaxID=2820812 RepID=A0ABS4AHD3_9PROT|nr:hypothetical protein [Pararoseomonas baculiformis]
MRLLAGAEVQDYAGAAHAGRGWRRQQGLKLDVHRVVESEAYVTLDCKNHFIRPTDASAFMEEGRLRMPPRGVQPGHMGAFRYFGVAEESWPEVIFGISTPFPMWRAEVEALDEALRARGLASAGMLPVSDDSVVEYRVYCAFLQACRGGWEAGHVLSQPPAVSFHGQGEDQLADFLSRLDRPGMRIMGVHRRAGWAAPAVKAAIIGQWMGFGLVRDAAEGETFLTPPAGARRPV